MALSDGIVPACFELCTEVPMEEIEEQKKAHPRDAKARLASEIIKLIYGEEKAEKAKEEFDKVFKEGMTPENVLEVKVREDLTIIDVLIESGVSASKSDARRLISGGGVEVDGKKIDDWEIKLKPGEIIKAGKYRFIKIIK